MHIEHIALAVKDLENMREFYETFFNAKSNEKYHNPKTQFQSYFLTFESGCRLELTNKKFFAESAYEQLGYAHIAISVGDKRAVDLYTDKFVQAGLPLLSGPRTTGDGYYEAVVQDPEGNLIELSTD